MLAVRVLRSGDICFTTRSAKEAEVARTLQGRAQKVCKDKKVHLPAGESLYMMSMVDEAPELKDAQARLIEEVKTLNQANRGVDAKAIKLHQGVVPEGEKSGSLIVELDFPGAANKAIDLTSLLGDVTRIRQQRLPDIVSSYQKEHQCIEGQRGTQGYREGEPLTNLPSTANPTKSAPAGRSRLMKREHGVDSPVGNVSSVSTSFTTAR
ncbi:hypothetical protein N7448_011307 [Penicillium atrosanguineum]|nr:hypothetical protein N7448_011307 [Penicillium atrosanguineum]